MNVAVVHETDCDIHAETVEVPTRRHLWCSDKAVAFCH